MWLKIRALLRQFRTIHESMNELRCAVAPSQEMRHPFHRILDMEHLPHVQVSTKNLHSWEQPRPRKMDFRQQVLTMDGKGPPLSQCALFGLYVDMCVADGPNEADGGGFRKATLDTRFWDSRWGELDHQLCIRLFCQDLLNNWEWTLGRGRGGVTKRKETRQAMFPSVIMRVKECSSRRSVFSVRCAPDSFSGAVCRKIQRGHPRRRNDSSGILAAPVPQCCCAW